MGAEQLRTLATLLREKAAQVSSETDTRCAQVIKAAQALNIIQEKLNGPVA